MLRSIRETTGSWVVKIFLGLLALSFGVWGIGDIFRGGQATNIASVGSIDISTVEFNNNYQREYQRLSQRLGGRMDQDQARELGLPESTLQQMVNRALLRQTAADLGLTVSTGFVVDEIRRNPGFRNSLGQFDKQIFDQALANSGFNEATYIAALRNDLAEEQLLGSVAGNARPSATLTDRLFAYRAERRVADLVVVPSAGVALSAQPTDADLKSHYDANIAQFTSPEFRSLGFFVLSPEELAKTIQIDEAELKRAYEDQAQEFTVPERREVEQLLYSNEEPAKEARKRLDEGGNITEIGKATNSLTADKPSLGMVTRERLSREIADDVFTQTTGSISGPLRSPFGWHVIRVVKIEPGHVRPLAEVRDQLRLEVAQQHATEVVYNLVNKVQDAFAGGSNLTETATRHNLKLVRISATDAQGRDLEGKPLAELPADIPDFVPAVFQARAGAEPALRDIDGGHYFAFQVDSVIPAAAKPFDTVKDQVRLSWENAQRDLATKRKAEELAGRLATGAPLPAQNSEGGVRVKTTPPLARFEVRVDPDVSLDLLTQLFRAKPGEAVVAAAPSGEGYVIARLKEIAPVRIGERNEERQQLVQSLTQALSNDIAQAYRGALTKRYGVEINRAALPTMF